MATQTTGRLARWDGTAPDLKDWQDDEIVDGLRQHEVGRLRTGFVQSFHLDLRRFEFRLGLGDVRFEFRHFERDEHLARFDGITLIDGNFGDVTGHFGVECRLLPGCERGGQ